MVNVHVLFLFPPLEHAPAQIASRPVDTLRVICVPGANDETAVLPTGTLMPAGFEMIRDPLRPDAVTVSATFVPGGEAVAPVSEPAIRSEAERARRMRRKAMLIEDRIRREPIPRRPTKAMKLESWPDRQEYSCRMVRERNEFWLIPATSGSFLAARGQQADARRP